MPARHYNLEYNVNSGPWLSGILDETPGAGKQITIGGLSVGTYAVKLRMVPLSGDTTPIVSNELVMQVGVPGISEPVVSINESVATVADVIQRRDALIAAAGVVVSPQDAQVMNEALLSTASESGSVITGVADTVTAAASSDATVTTVQVMLEQVVTAITATATAADTYTPAASIPVAPAITSITPGNTQNVIDLGTSSGATSYNLYWSTTETLAANIVASGTKITSPSDPYTHTGLTNGTTYRYVQTAVNAAGESGPSAVVSGVPVGDVAISYVGTGASLNELTFGEGKTINYPAGTQVGDFVLLASNNSAIPAGWTQIAALGAAGGMYYKFASSETSVTFATSDPTGGDGSGEVANIWAFRGVNASPIDAKDSAFHLYGSFSTSIAGTALTNTYAGSVVSFITQSARTPTSAGGAGLGMTLITASNPANFHLAYSTAQAAGLVAAPTMTYGETINPNIFTVSLRD